MNSVYHYVGVFFTWSIGPILAIGLLYFLYFLIKTAILAVHFLSWIRNEKIDGESILINVKGINKLYIVQWFHSFAMMWNYDDNNTTITSKKRNVYSPPKFYRKKSK